MSEFLQFVMETSSRETSSRQGDDKRTTTSGESAAGSASSKGGKKKFSISSVFASSSKAKCGICGGGHAPSGCRDLKNKSPHWLLKFSRQESLCQACFQPYGKGHSCNKVCNKPGCGKRHHSYMHDVVIEHEKRATMGGSQASGGSRDSSGDRRSSEGFGSRFAFRKPDAPGAGRGKDPAARK